MMSSSGRVHIFSGDGKGKTSAAVGQGIKAASAGKSVVMIQFLKGKDSGEFDILRKLEPDIKLFSFEKSDEIYEDLTEDRRREEIQNIENGIHFARKVLATGACDVLILDEFLGLIDTGIIGLDELKGILEAVPAEADLILTGINVSGDVRAMADDMTTLTTTVFA